MKKFIYLIVVLGFVSCNSSSPAPVSQSTPEASQPVRVGVFNGNGAGPTSVIETIEALKIDKDIEAYPVSAADIVNGKLKDTDLLIFPGGSGSKELNNLGDLGQQKVKEFIREGKSAMGICAGAYLFCNTETYPSLKLAAVRHLDRKHYNRGRGLIEVKLNENGLAIFPELAGQKVFLQYYDGPILENLHTDPSVRELAYYVSDIHPNPGDPVGFTPGKLFMYEEKIGKGKILAIGGHAESTPGMRWMIPRMARWITDGKIIDYPEKWIKPDINQKEILFDPALKAKESRWRWQLYEKDPEKVLPAMDSLYAIRSRPFVRWNVGLLRNHHPEIRKKAVAILQKTEYTHALPDLKAAYRLEKEPALKKRMKKTLEKFEN